MSEKDYSVLQETYTIEDFRSIVAGLRGENGCPWDKVQTHASLKSCMTEEAAEVLAAIRILDNTGNPENLKEELGDVLLQVVMHSQIADEEGYFTFSDVINEVCRKMVRRHPHVFGTAEAENPRQALQNWEAIKKEEKAGQAWVQTPLRDIPKEFPSLARAQKVQKKADKLYEPLPAVHESITAIRGVLDALEAAEENRADTNASEAVSELLWHTVNLAKETSVSAEHVLFDKIDAFIDKYENN